MARFLAVAMIQAPGLVRRSSSGPALERGRERILNRVLGELEVTEDADEDRDGACPFLTKEGLDRGYVTSGRISTDPFEASGTCCASSIA